MTTYSARSSRVNHNDLPPGIHNVTVSKTHTKREEMTGRTNVIVTVADERGRTAFAPFPLDASPMTHPLLEQLYLHTGVALGTSLQDAHPLFVGEPLRVGVEHRGRYVNFTSILPRDGA